MKAYRTEGQEELGIRCSTLLRRESDPRNQSTCPARRESVANPANAIAVQPKVALTRMVSHDY